MSRRKFLTGSGDALSHLRSIFIGGLAGKRLPIPISPLPLEQAAQAVLSKEAFAYIAGGAGMERTISLNRNAFERWQIVPQMLRDVSEFQMEVDLFGARHPSPFLLAPVGVLELAHKEADLAVAKAAAAEAVPFIFSNQASVSMEQCSTVMADKPRWFQLYWSKSRELVASFVDRAEKCGCTAIVLTLDTTMLGWRNRDVEMAYLPFLHGMGMAQYTSDPVFNRMIQIPVPTGPSPKNNARSMAAGLSLMRRYPGNTLKHLVTGIPLKAIRKFTETYTNPSLNWEDLRYLRGLTGLPILLKGILHPSDAQKAMDYGMDGIIVSNHGGRQIDNAIPSLVALPQIAEVVKGKIPVILDSGVRSGADAFVAIALGAKAVCIGRPYVYALAVAGQEGVKCLIQNWTSEFELTMRLAGCRNVYEINSSFLQSTNG